MTVKQKHLTFNWCISPSFHERQSHRLEQGFGDLLGISSPQCEQPDGQSARVLTATKIY